MSLEGVELVRFRGVKASTVRRDVVSGLALLDSELAGQDASDLFGSAIVLTIPMWRALLYSTENPEPDGVVSLPSYAVAYMGRLFGRACFVTGAVIQKTNGILVWEARLQPHQALHTFFGQNCDLDMGEYWRDFEPAITVFPPVRTYLDPDSVQRVMVVD